MNLIKNIRKYSEGNYLASHIKLTKSNIFVAGIRDKEYIDFYINLLNRNKTPFVLALADVNLGEKNSKKDPKRWELDSYCFFVDKKDQDLK